MEHDNKKYLRVKKSLVILAVVVLAALVIGYFIGQSKDKNNQQAVPGNPQTTQNNDIDNTEESSQEVKSVVSYTVPDGWNEVSCPDSKAVYLQPRNADVDCDATPPAPIKVSIDSAGNTDCNQLQNKQDVSKHVCITEYINDMLSLKAQTIYTEQSSYGQKLVFDSYYINTGSDVVLVEYIQSEGDNQYQADWEQFAKSVRKQ